MAQNMLLQVIPESDNEEARALGAEFVAKLIQAAVEPLVAQVEIDTTDRPQPITFDTMSRAKDADKIIDTVDIDTLIGRHLEALALLNGSEIR